MSNYSDIINKKNHELDYVAFLDMVLNMRNIGLGTPFHDIYGFPTLCLGENHVLLSVLLLNTLFLVLFFIEPFVELFPSNCQNELAYTLDQALELDSVSVMDLPETSSLP